MYICHIRIGRCVCYNSVQISLIRTPSERKPVTHFLECVQRLQYLNQLFRNLCQRYEVRLWHIPFNQFHTIWIDCAPCLHYYANEIAYDQKLLCSVRIEPVTCTVVSVYSMLLICPSVQVELHFRELLDSVVTLGISEKVGYQLLFQGIVVYKVS